MLCGKAVVPLKRAQKIIKMRIPGSGTRYCLYSALLAVLSCGVNEPGPDEATVKSAQVLGTIHQSRNKWNPYASENNMIFDEINNRFFRTQKLTTRGGLNGDGIYAIRFNINHDLNSVFKWAGSQNLITGRDADGANNIIFKVKEDREYTIVFSAVDKKFEILPMPEYLSLIESIQLNGFVYNDQNGDRETSDERRTYPIEKWNETLSSHNMKRKSDGSYSKEVFLTTDGGLQHDGVYQFLFTANHIGDWGFSALNDRPGKLCAGSGYNSKMGRVVDSPLVIRVTKEGTYTFTMDPVKLEYRISPDVEHMNGLDSVQLNGYVVPEPWKVKEASHQMKKNVEGIWEKTVSLTSDGGPGKDGVYCINFSLNNDWHLDSVGMSTVWGEIWHTLPQENNIIFKVEKDADYTISLDPAKDTFAISPRVLPVTEIRSFQIVGNFKEFSADGNNGWNPYDPIHQMESKNGQTYMKILDLEIGVAYNYKFTANGTGWIWAFADYIFDGYRVIASHGDPPPIIFTAAKRGPHMFTADIITGEYSVDYFGK
jgi:hypothetical protein